MQVELLGVDVAALAGELKTGMRNQDQNQREQEKDAAGRREFFKYRPEEFLDDVKMVPARRQSLGSLGRDVLGIQPVTGPRLGFKLRPQLADLEPFRHASPEVPEMHAE